MGMSEDKKNLLRQVVRDTVSEMPVRNITKVGNFEKGGGFKKVDKAILGSEKGIKKITNQWYRTEFDFDFYFTQVPKLNKPEYREHGVFTPEQQSGVEEIIDQEITPNSEGISIIFNGNSGAEKVMMTGWVMAHRFGHSVRASRSDGRIQSAWADYVNDVNDSLKGLVRDVYDINNLVFNRTRSQHGGEGESMVDINSQELFRHVVQQLSTFKSARDKKINRFYEFYYELFAQYLITGKIEFNVPPENIVVAMGPWGRKETRKLIDPDLAEMWGRDLGGMADQIQDRIMNVLYACQGKIFLM